jgi:RecJ-like exonuclease
MKPRSVCIAFASLLLAGASASFGVEEALITPVPPSVVKAAQAPAAEAGKLYAAKDLNTLRPLVGQEVTVEGTITQSGQNKSKSIRYLNFAKNYNDAVSLVFFVSKGGEAFALEKLTPWVGRKVKATGKLTEYNDRLQIEIAKLEQLKEVQEPAPAPEAK